MTKTITTERSKGGRSTAHRASKTPQSRGRLSAVSVCQLEGCDKPLTGRQRVACSDSHRALASKQRRQDAPPPTRTPQRVVDHDPMQTALGSRKPAYSWFRNTRPRGAPRPSR
jgi:hypothetical protein